MGTISKLFLRIVLVLSCAIPILSFSQIANATPNLREPLISSKFDGLSVSSGGSGLPFCVTNTSNPGRLIDDNISNNSTQNITGIGCNRWVQVTDSNDTYPAGTMAGFVIGAGGLLGGSLASTVKVDTYNNGTFQETLYQSSSTVGVNSTLVNGDGTIQVGAVTTKDFDALRITYNSLVGFLFSGEVNYAFIKRYEAGPTLTCNTTYNFNNTTFPVEIVSERTGYTSIVSDLLTFVQNAYNVISPSTTDYATMGVGSTVGAAAYISVKDQLTTYPAGVYAGFDISRLGVSFEFFSGFEVVTLLNGTEQEAKGVSEIIDFLDIGRQIVGFTTTKPFNEIQIRATQGVGVSVTLIAVYNAIIRIPNIDVPVINITNSNCNMPQIATITNYSASNIYTFSPAGPTISSTGVISGLNSGTNYLLSVSNAWCSRSASLKVNTLICNAITNPSLPSGKQK